MTLAFIDTEAGARHAAGVDAFEAARDQALAALAHGLDDHTHGDTN